MALVEAAGATGATTPSQGFFGPLSGWQRRGAALGLQHPVFAGLQELKANHPPNCLEILFHPNHPHQRNKSFRPGQFESRPNLDLPLRRETSSAASYIRGFNVILKLIAMLIATRNLEPNLQMHTLGFSGDEVPDRRLLFFHKFDWIVGTLNQIAYLRVSKNPTQDKRQSWLWVVRVAHKLTKKVAGRKEGTVPLLLDLRPPRPFGRAKVEAASCRRMPLPLF